MSEKHIDSITVILTKRQVKKLKALSFEDGVSRKIYAGSSDTHLSLLFDGTQKNVEIFWAGNALNVHAEEDEG